MPDDLLSHLIGPTPYSALWLWVAVALTVALIGWYVCVFVFTKPGRQVPVLTAARTELAKRRSVRAVRGIGTRFRQGELTAAQAAAELSREVREFLHAVTGLRAQYMQVGDIADGELAPAAPLLSDLTDLQFNRHTAVDADVAGRAAEELIRTWT
ncbi:hypothetical protein KL953_01410 [Mycolicibacterium goodii]|uniref:hypothetical protein n=1 Tax=Mycolicibacterium goodii TaxID=134601 RepID=UPI000C257C3D|nr:hypothetical protein [Mycolicibacterium goodii]MBU8807546.1 hypothetical protein [Mycolicibacterium goodii]MBU8814373.1 hypothetical protein [Mycolicibacterium goodii]PJK23583.1 hypothetical protein CSX11_04580 [Mycolicibacterium goodii]